MTEAQSNQGKALPTQLPGKQAEPAEPEPAESEMSQSDQLKLLQKLMED